MEKKNNCLRAGFSTILWCVLAILLFTTPSVQAYDINDLVTGDLWVWPGETVNLLTGAHITGNLFALGMVNIHGGEVDGCVSVCQDAAVTVYGQTFTVGEDSYSAGTYQVFITLALGPSPGPLTGVYEDGQLVNLEIDCYYEVGSGGTIINEETVTLVASGGGGPAEIAIDIKPGSDPNPINPGSNGLVPVAILTTDDFNAADVNSATVTLAGAEVAVRGKADKLMARLEDVDGDGDLDLLVQVETQSEGALWVSGPVTLNGTTYGGQPIEGQDDVIIVPPE